MQPDIKTTQVLTKQNLSQMKLNWYFEVCADNKAPDFFMIYFSCTQQMEAQGHKINNFKMIIL